MQEQTVMQEQTMEYIKTIDLLSYWMLVGNMLEIEELSTHPEVSDEDRECFLLYVSGIADCLEIPEPRVIDMLQRYSPGNSARVVAALMADEVTTGKVQPNNNPNKLAPKENK